MTFEEAVAEERLRRRIAADLHDRIGQQLAVAQITLSAVRKEATGLVAAAIDRVLTVLAQSAVDTRTLIFELSPPVLYELGMDAALQWLVGELERHYGLRTLLTNDGAEKPLDETTAAIAFRTIRELLMNTLKHAQSPTAYVVLRRTGDQLDVTVKDRGVGFERAAARSSPDKMGFGLASVQEQIRGLGGTVQITSARGRGTCVRILLPLKGARRPRFLRSDALA